MGQAEDRVLWWALVLAVLNRCVLLLERQLESLGKCSGFCCGYVKQLI